MITRSYKRFWFEGVSRDINFFRDYGSNNDVFKNWESDWSPDRATSRLLNYGLELLYAGNPEQLAMRFLVWVSQRVDRACDEQKFEHPRSTYPLNRARGLRYRAHARFLLRGELCEDDLAQSIRDYASSNKCLPKHLWDAQAEVDVLAPARLALILGDLEAFDRLLPFRLPFNCHSEEYKLLCELRRALAGSARVEGVVANDFQSYFDRVRDPDYRPDIFTEVDILRLELGIIYCEYIDSSGVLTPSEVIQSISR